MTVETGKGSVEAERRLPDTHQLLAGMLTQTVGDQTSHWVPRDRFEAMVDERDNLRRALALVNVAITCGGISARTVLDKVGETAEQARVTAGVLASVRRDRPSSPAPAGS